MSVVAADSVAKDSLSIVWEAYRAHHPRAVLDDRRRKLIEKRVREFELQDLIDAIEGNHIDPHCNGKNLRGKEYHDLGLILRSADHIERYGDIWRSGGADTAAKRAWRRAQELKERGE